METILQDNSGERNGDSFGQWREFVSTIFDSGDLVLLRWIETWEENGKKRSHVYQTDYVTALELGDPDVWQGMLTFGEDHNANHFFGVCPRQGRWKFDLACQVSTIRCLWADLDDCGPVEAVGRCEKAELLKPSIVVSSGHGTHLYWMLSEPITIRLDYEGPISKEGGRFIGASGDEVVPDDLLTAQARHVQSVILGISRKIGGDSTFDLARLLRCPGTPNRKNVRNGAAPQPCQLIECHSDRRYSFLNFEAFAVEIPHKKIAEKKPVEPNEANRINGHHFASHLTDEHRSKLTQMCDEAEASGDRSRADFSTIAYAVREGLNADDVFPVVGDRSKFADAGHGYFSRTWENAESLIAEAHEAHATRLGLNVEEILDSATYRASNSANPMLSDKTPRKTAHTFLTEFHPEGTLKFECPDVWRVWDGRVYVEIDEQHLRAEVSEFLDRSWTMDKDGKVIPLAATPSREAATLQEIKNLTTLPPGVRPPSWISGVGPAPENMVSFANGHLDVERYLGGDKRTMIEHSPNWYSLHCLPHDFDPEAACPQWISFLNEVYEGDEERVRFLQQWFGYCLTSDMSLERFLILFGPPRSGKGTITTVLNDVLGKHNVASPRLKKLGSEFGLWSLVGKLVALVPDAHLPKSDNSDVLEVLKLITGNDTVDIERKHKQSIDNVKLITRIVISANDLPSFNDNSTALADRAIILPHQVSFKDKADPGLKHRLRQEVVGVTNWALEGLASLRRDGVLIPAISQKAHEAWRTTMSPIAEFVDRCCVVQPNSEIPIGHLYRVYEDWCLNERHHPVAKGNFLCRLQTIVPKIDVTRPRRPDGTRPKCYSGISLSSFGQRRLRQFPDAQVTP